MSAMSDLDADLRNLVGNPYIHTESVDKLKAEIERLRFLASGQNDPHSVALAKAADEIERLREALREIATSQPSDSEQAFKFKMLARAALGEKE